MLTLLPLPWGLYSWPHGHVIDIHGHVINTLMLVAMSRHVARAQRLLSPVPPDLLALLTQHRMGWQAEKPPVATQAVRRPQADPPSWPAPQHAAYSAKHGTQHARHSMHNLTHARGTHSPTQHKNLEAVPVISSHNHRLASFF